MCASNVVDLNCPGCGASVSTQQKSCAYCGRELVISSFTSVFSMGPQETKKYVDSYRAALQCNPSNAMLNSSIAMCFLNLRLYDKAIEAFERAIEDDFDNPETYFYAAVSLLKGRKAFMTPMGDIRKAEQYIAAALSIEPRGVFYYFQAYLRYDFYARKSLNAYPNFREFLALAVDSGLSEFDASLLQELLGVEVVFS